MNGPGDSDGDHQAGTGRLPDAPISPDAIPAPAPPVATSVTASGDRSVALGRDLTNSAVVTGDNNQVTIDQREIHVSLQAGIAEVEVHIGPPAPDGTAPVRTRGPTRAEPALGTLRLPFSQMELQLGAMWAEQGADDEQVRRFGAQLFGALFTPEVAAPYHEARVSTAPLRVRLLIESSTAASVPWELLYDPDRGEYLAVDATVVRGSMSRGQTQPRHIAGPTRALLVDTLTAGTGADRNQLSGGGIARELRRLVRLRQLATTVVSCPSPAVLESTLETVAHATADAGTNEPACHLLHLLATARLDPQSGQPVLTLGRDTDTVETLDAEALARLLRPLGHVPILVSLAASTRVPASTVAAVFGPALLTAGAPAVVFLPTARLTKQAGRVLRELYSGLVESRPLDVALRDAWSAVQDTAQNRSPDLGRPICFLRPGTGQLLDVEPAEPIELSRHPASWWPWLHESVSPLRVVASVSVLVMLLAALVILAEPIGRALAAPAPMTGAFNVAVTRLRYDPAGCIFGNRFETFPYEVSKEWFKRLEQKVKALPNGDRNQVEYYDTPVADEDHLRTFGEAVQADAVIYGEVSCEHNQAIVDLNVYLTGRSMADRDAGELVGSHQLGASIATGGDPQLNNNVYISMRNTLDNRASATASLLGGLAVYPSGDWGSAESAFQEAIDGLSASTAGTLSNPSSMPVLYLFVGKVSSQMRQWPRARTAYEMALSLKPDYLRARLGLAEVEYHEAAEASSRDNTICRTNSAVFTEKLQSLISTYEEALTLVPEPDVAHLRLKAHYYLGRAHTCVGLITTREDAFVLAEKEYRVVTDTYETAQYEAARPWCQMPLLSGMISSCAANQNEVVRNWTADAYAGRGFVILRSMQAHGYTADEAAAAEALYTAAFNLSNNQTQQAGYVLQVAIIHRDCRRYAQAADALSTASVLDPTRAPVFRRFQQSLTPVPPSPGVTPTATPMPC